jgi:hypothetical protein
MPSFRITLGAIGAAILLLATSAAFAGVGDYTCTDPKRVYYGNSRLFQRPCEISCDRCYQRIPEYQEILRRGLTDKDAQYHLLMKRATARFSAAVKKMARKNNHDLAAETGAVTRANEKAAAVPDRTDDVIRALD